MKVSDKTLLYQIGALAVLTSFFIVGLIVLSMLALWLHRQVDAQYTKLIVVGGAVTYVVLPFLVGAIMAHFDDRAATVALVVFVTAIIGMRTILARIGFLPMEQTVVPGELFTLMATVGFLATFLGNFGTRHRLKLQNQISRLRDQVRPRPVGR